MKKKAVLLAFCLCVGGLAGCEKTPENVVVREKGAGSIREYESTEQTGSSFYESLGAPEHYTNRASYEGGRLVIDTDADVILPDADAVNTYAVTAEEVSQELIDRVTEVFFPGGTFYHAEYLTETKEECQRKITELKKYKAEGNPDPYQYGRDENGAYYFDIDTRIAQYEESLAEAPEEKNEEEIRPSFGLTYLSGDPEDSEVTVADDYFYGIARVEDRLYDYEFHRMGPGIEFQISKIRSGEENRREVSYWVTGEELMDSGDEAERLWTRDEVERFLKISYEEAEALASEKAEALGMSLTAAGWDYELCYRGNEGIRESNVIDGGYLFYFVRELDGVPVTYTAETGGGYEGDISEEPTYESWKYERCNITVAGEGICAVELCNPYEVGGQQISNVKLMDFDSIIRIYGQMMEISNADLSADEKLRTYHIRRITLGYGRIYDPTVDNAAGLLVPVWDFFGEFDVEGDGYQIQNSGEHSTRSFLTVNAIDGTLIDRELGY